MSTERCKDIGEDCWELILNHLPNHTHFDPLSLVCKQFLNLTNRLRTKLSITDTLIFFHPQISSLINKRFPNLNSIDFSTYHGNLDVLLLGIANCCVLSRLHEVDLSNCCRMPVRGLKEMGGIRVLKCYRMRVLRDNDLVSIANSLPLLEELDISYPRTELDLTQGGSGGATQMTLTDFGIRVLSVGVKNLRRINVSGNHFITVRSLVYLSENCVFLEGVDVVDCTLITAKGVLFLLRNSVHLSSISVSGIEIRKRNLGSEDLSYMGRGLCSIYLRNSSVSDEFMHILVEACVDLKRLSLVNCTEFTVSSLVLLLRRCQLQHLTLSKIDLLTDDSIVQLFPYLRNLVSLQLSVSSRLTVSTFYMVANSCPSLELLEMECSCCGITDSPLVSVQYANIRSLNLSSSFLDDNCLRRIASACPNLKMLDISNCLRITEKCLAEILDTCHDIRHLSIAGCQINPIGQGLELPNLEVLHAADSAINDEGLVQLASRCPRVVKLELAGCNQVTDSGVKVVVGTCQVLREINLSGCSNVNARIVDWMLFTRPSLVKIVPPSYTSITDNQKRFYLQHGCQIWVGSKPKILKF